MAATNSKHRIYSNIAENMREELSNFTLPKETPNEKSLIEYIQSTWNAIINNGAYWYDMGKQNLKHTAFLKKLNYDIKQETLRIGKKILRVAKKLKFKCREAKKKQRDFIEELEDRLEFIKIYY